MAKKKRIFRFVLEVLLIFLCISTIIFNDLVVYGLSQGKGQLKIVMNAVPVKDVLADPAVPDSIKRKLSFINDVRNYAFDSLGINRSENYTTFFDQKGRPLLWVLTASMPYEMKPYQWTFPVVGRVGYKGFFNWNRALIERATLKEEGYDTDLGKVGGWSTLGYFKDPVLSQMLRHNEGMLAELIIHELTHGTIYVKSDVNFNENLASFIGEKGAERYINSRFGPDSKQLEDYRKSREDEKMFSGLALKYAQKLDSLYKGVVNADSLKNGKLRLIYSFVRDIRHAPFSNSGYKDYAKKAYSSGNAFFLSYVRYDSQAADFEKEFVQDFNGNLKSYLAALKEKHGVR